jgi:hypothetical protein
MVLKQPKRDKRTDTCKGNAIPKTVLVLLLFLSKVNQLQLCGCKVKKTVGINLTEQLKVNLTVYFFYFL